MKWPETSPVYTVYTRDGSKFWEIEKVVPLPREVEGK